MRTRHLVGHVGERVDLFQPARILDVDDEVADVGGQIRGSHSIVLRRRCMHRRKVKGD